MSKYIIELRPDCKVVQQICASDENVGVGARSVELLDALTDDYVKENFKDLLEGEYQRGLEDGKKATWEAVRKVIHLPEAVVLDLFTDCYSSVCTVLQVFLKYEGSEVIEKLKAYEEKQKADDKIEVGDEVEWDNDFTGDRFIVTRIYQPYGKKEQCDGIDDDGDVYRAVLIESLVKTGRHFDIQSILEDMRHD